MGRRLAALLLLPALAGCPAGRAAGGAGRPVGPSPSAPPVEPVEPPEVVEPPPSIEPPPAPAVEPPPALPEPAGPSVADLLPPAPGFLDGDDDAILAVICDAVPADREHNQRGTTISFRLRFEDGTSAAYKPEQASSHSHWEAEVAAYRLSRFLRINRVPPSCELDATRDELLGAGGVTLAVRGRLEAEVAFDGDGVVRGAAMYWVDGLRGFDEWPVDGDWRGWLAHNGRIPAGREAEAAALSDLLLLDWLTLNVDRWSGGNVRRQGGEDGPLVFIDNAAGFGTNPWDIEGRVWPMFRVAERFRAPVAAALRELTDEAIDALLGDVLSGEQRQGLRERRDRALARLDELLGRFGEDTVLRFE